MTVNSSYSDYSRLYASYIKSAGMYDKLAGLYKSSASSSGGLLSGGLFSGGINSSTMSYVTSIKGGSSKLAGALGDMSSLKTYAKETAISSDTTALEIKSSGSALASGLDVKIDQIASGQVNKGFSLNSDTKVGQGGNMQFEIAIDGENHKFSINVSANDTNEGLQKKMAEAINAADIGVKASVSTDSKNNVSALSIEAEATGTGSKGSFEIRDITGNAVSATGTDIIASMATDAVYSINGGVYKTSEVNNVDLGYGITAQLKKASEDAVTISMSTDSAGIADKAKAFVESYNELLSTAYENSGDKGASRLAGQVSSAAKTYSSSLSKIGISVNQNGYLSIDNDKLSKAEQDGSLKSFFTEDRNKNYGFANQLSRVTENVGSNPARYVGNFNAGLSDSSSSGSYSSLLSGQNNQFYGMGLLMDFLI